MSRATFPIGTVFILQHMRIVAGAAWLPSEQHGIICMSKGQWLWFVLGIFLPLFWFVGAILPAKR